MPREHRLPSGHRVFAQYAHAPNALGYCGPPGSERLQAVACGAAPDTDVVALAKQFSGAWPYQEVIAQLAGIPDPLDENVVRAYWTSDELSDRIDRAEFGAALLARLASQAGHYWKHLTEDLLGEAAPTHNFHVFGVYPWSRLLDTGMPQPLQVLDSCRIRWGEVVGVDHDRAVVRSRRLSWDAPGCRSGPNRTTRPTTACPRVHSSPISPWVTGWRCTGISCATVSTRIGWSGCAGRRNGNLHRPISACLGKRPRPHENGPTRTFPSYHDYNSRPVAGSEPT